VADSPHAPRHPDVLSCRSFHPAQAHEAAGQTGVHQQRTATSPGGQLTPGAGGVRDRAIPHRHGGLPATEFFRQYAGHSARLSAEGGASGFMVRLILGRDPLANYGIYSGLRAVREPRARGRQRGVPGLGEVSTQDLGLGTGPETSRSWSATVNRIRRTHPALALSRNLRFLESSNSNIIAYAKPTSKPGRRPGDDRELGPAQRSGRHSAPCPRAVFIGRSGQALGRGSAGKAMS